MGYFREKNHEGVKEIQENSKETIELGSEMTEQADHINSILESIELQDDEDIMAMSETGRSYQNSFDSVFSEQVESSGQEIGKQGEQIKESVDGELENVHSGIGKLEKIMDISDIGREVAEAGHSKLEKSIGKYEEINFDAENAVDETMKQIEVLKNNLSGIFG